VAEEGVVRILNLCQILALGGGVVGCLELLI